MNTTPAKAKIPVTQRVPSEPAAYHRPTGTDEKANPNRNIKPKFRPRNNREYPAKVASFANKPKAKVENSIWNTASDEYTKKTSELAESVATALSSAFNSPQPSPAHTPLPDNRQSIPLGTPQDNSKTTVVQPGEVHKI